MGPLMHNRRIVAIVSADRVADVEAALVALLGPSYAGALTVPLSPTGAEPATHYAASSQETETTRTALLPLLDPSGGVYAWAGQIPGDEYTANTVTDSTSLPACDPADMRWTFEACLQSLGLQRVQSTPPGF